MDTKRATVLLVTLLLHYDHAGGSGRDEDDLERSMSNLHAGSSNPGYSSGSGSGNSGEAPDNRQELAVSWLHADNLPNYARTIGQQLYTRIGEIQQRMVGDPEKTVIVGDTQITLDQFDFVGQRQQPATVDGTVNSRDSSTTNSHAYAGVQVRVKDAGLCASMVIQTANRRKVIKSKVCLRVKTDNTLTIAAIFIVGLSRGEVSQGQYFLRADPAVDKKIWGMVYGSVHNAMTDRWQSTMAHIVKYGMDRIADIGRQVAQENPVGTIAIHVVTSATTT